MFFRYYCGRWFYVVFKDSDVCSSFVRILHHKRTISCTAWKHWNISWCVRIPLDQVAALVGTTWGNVKREIPLYLQMSIRFNDTCESWLSNRRRTNLYLVYLVTAKCIMKIMTFSSIIQPEGRAAPTHPVKKLLFEPNSWKDALSANVIVTRVSFSADVTAPTCLAPFFATMRLGFWTVVTVVILLCN